MITWNHEDQPIKFWREQDIFHLDVRPLLEKGGEPYQFIMECVGQITPRDTLVLHALFDPKPLRRILGEMGYKVSGVHQGQDHWEVTIRSGG